MDGDGCGGVVIVDIVRYSTASQTSGGGSRVGAARKNVEGTSSTDNELADCLAARPQIPPADHDAGATSTATLPAAGSDPATTGSDTTVAAAAQSNPGPPTANRSPPAEHRIAEGGGGGQEAQLSSVVPASLPQLPTATPLATTVRRFRQRRRQQSFESNPATHAASVHGPRDQLGFLNF